MSIWRRRKTPFLHLFRSFISPSGLPTICLLPWYSICRATPPIFFCPSLKRQSSSKSPHPPDFSGPNCISLIFKGFPPKPPPITLLWEIRKHPYVPVGWYSKVTIRKVYQLPAKSSFPPVGLPTKWPSSIPTLQQNNPRTICISSLTYFFFPFYCPL